MFLPGFVGVAAGEFVGDGDAGGAERFAVVADPGADGAVVGGGFPVAAWAEAAPLAFVGVFGFACVGGVGHGGTLRRVVCGGCRAMVPRSGGLSNSDRGHLWTFEHRLGLCVVICPP